MSSEHWTWDINLYACDWDRLHARGFVDSHGNHDSDETFAELSACIREVLTEWYNRVGKHVLDGPPDFFGDIEDTCTTNT